MLKRFLDVSEFSHTIKRFPVCFVFAIITFVITFIEINVLNLPKDIFGRALLFCICGFFYACNMRIIFDSGALKHKLYKTILIAGLCLYGILVLVLSKDSPNTWVMLSHFVVANFIVLFIAPYIGKRNIDISLWEYNRRLWLGVSIAFLASVIFWAGFSGALASFGYLFEIKIDGDIYTTLWAFAAILLAPLYALSNIPKQFEYEEKDCELRRSLTFFVQWLLLPLVLFYFVILYAYFGKILILVEIPKGQLAYMILGFSGAGILTFLTSLPYQLDQKKPFKFLRKYFFPLLILPSLVLAYAVFLRVEQYGITTQRFYLSAIAIYLIMISIMMSFKFRNIKNIFTLFIVMLVVTSTPFFNARTTAIDSQKAVLFDVLQKNDMFENGEIIAIKDPEIITDEDQMRITQQVQYLDRLFTKSEKEEYWGTDENLSNKDIFKKMFGFSPLYKYEFERAQRDIENKKFSYYLSSSKIYNLSSSKIYKNQLLDVKNYDYISLKEIRVRKRSNTSDLRFWDEKSIGFQLVGNKLSVMTAPDHEMIKVPVTFDLSQILVDALSEYPKVPDMEKPIIIKKSNGYYDMKVAITRLSGEFNNNKPELEHVVFYLMYKEKSE